MEKADIVLTFLPQADGVRKNRPALILFRSEPFGDFVVCGISTRLHNAIKEMDEILEFDSSDFLSSGLSTPSVIRTLFLASVSPKNIKGLIGKISDDRYRRIVTKLARHFHQLDR